MCKIFSITKDSAQASEASLSQRLLDEARKHLDKHCWLQSLPISNPRSTFDCPAVYASPSESFSFLSNPQQLQYLLSKFPECKYNGQVLIKKSRLGKIDQVLIKRDFISAFVWGDPTALLRFSNPNNEIFGNCLEFIYLIFLRSGILTQSELTLIANQKYSLSDRLMRAVRSHASEHDRMPGDFVVWFGLLDSQWHHIGIVSELLSSEQEKSISLDSIGQTYCVREEPNRELSRRPYYISPLNFLKILDKLISDQQFSLRQTDLPDYMRTPAREEDFLRFTKDLQFPLDSLDSVILPSDKEQISKQVKVSAFSPSSCQYDQSSKEYVNTEHHSTHIVSSQPSDIRNGCSNRGSHVPIERRRGGRGWGRGR